MTSSPLGAAVYLDSGYQGTTSAASGQLTLPGIPVGVHRVDVLKEGYGPFTATVTVANGQTVPVTATLNDEDLDGDGLPDGFENGYRDGFGRWQTLNPYLIDTDGDGLSDGFEAGEMVIDANGKTYFKQRSDPTKADTDGDGLNDLAEFEYGTDPFNPDTDGDGLRDSADPDPLTPQAGGDVDLAKIGRAIILGAVFGETGLPGGLFYGMVGEETASSPYYMVGWIGFSCLPAVGGIADIRDAVQAILNGDPVGAAMNAAGAIPGPGDGIKITGAIACYTGKFPWKARELGVLLSKELLGSLPDAIKIQVWDLLFDGAGSALRNTHGVPVEAIEALAKKNVDLVHVRGFLEATFDGNWVTRKNMDVNDYIAEHFRTHGHEFIPPILTEVEYKQRATALINRRDSGPNGVELYYQEGHDTLVVYDRIAKELASGTKGGLIVTFYKTDDAYISSIASRLTRLN
ncbi:PEGA domain-containing protein [Methanoculleus sp. Wushi-C6]|uniref:PEGA domain-containing protein n=1 Tax=Methanoculleus caldifontis TaxID=2651577 RepID=A0ABU3WZM1_9EURY|nr:PEGA domain-containing protein [Methanoculleus sp. Wushi-C6]